ncbi:MAG: hypothetical protein ACPGFA_07850 [Pikeienuella sp.]
MLTKTYVNSLDERERAIALLEQRLKFLKMMEDKLRERRKQPGADVDYINVQLVENIAEQNRVRDEIDDLEKGGGHINVTTVEDVMDLQEATKLLATFNIKSRAAVSMVTEAAKIFEEATA